jgi:hypothetical protein
MLDTGCWILDAGYWMLDTGYWMRVAGCGFFDCGLRIAEFGFITAERIESWEGSFFITLDAIPRRVIFCGQKPDCYYETS